MKQENIIFFTQLPPPYAGPEIMTQGFIDYFKKNNFNLIVIKSNIQSSNFQKGKISLKGILKFLLRYIKLLTKLINKNNSKIYLTIACGKVGFLRDFIVIMTASLFRKKIYIHLHGGNFDNFYQNSGKIFKKLIKTAWGKANCAIVLSETLKSSQLINAAPEVHLEIVNNGIKINNFKINKSRKYNKSEYTICFLGTLCFTKGFYDLIEVYKKLRNDNINLKINIAGEYPVSKPQLSEFLSDALKSYYMIHYKEITEEMQKFIDNIKNYNGKYWGVINDEKKSEFFNDSDIFILPSYMEGVSISMLEAMAHGLPIITTNVGGHKDIIKVSENGFVIEKGDKNALYEKIKYLLQNPELCKKMSYNNIKKIEEEFNIEKSAEMLYKTLNQ